jgi:hypothetical protein
MGIWIRRNKMATYYEIATDIVLENITVERKYIDGIHKGYRITANEGYVLHSPSLDSEVFDPMTGETRIEQYYYRQWNLTAVRPISTWDWHAVLESSVPADMIFGGGGNNAEVM